jgi:hypothetical protein
MSNQELKYLIGIYFIIKILDLFYFNIKIFILLINKIRIKY